MFLKVQSSGSIHLRFRFAIPNIMIRCMLLEAFDRPTTMIRSLVELRSMVSLEVPLKSRVLSIVFGRLSFSVYAA